MRQKLKRLLVILKKEERRAQKRVKKNKDAANETSKTSRTSWSAAGEREYSESQVQIAQEYQRSINKLEQEIRNSLNSPVAEKVATPSFVQVKVGGKKDAFYLIGRPMHISKIRVVSQSSPLGRAIAGKKKGDMFNYLVGDNKIEGKILKIE